jgi:hypothetical protein
MVKSVAFSTRAALNALTCMVIFMTHSGGRDEKRSSFRAQQSENHQNRSWSMKFGYAPMTCTNNAESEMAERWMIG